jgi:membrane-associated protease RseP (regulator of RpoE activity)
MPFEPISKSREDGFPIRVRDSGYPPSDEPNDQARFSGRWRLPLLLIGLTFLSTTYAGAAMQGVDLLRTWDFGAGIRFSGPLMAILLAHEFGHYLAAHRHLVPASPPYFIPVPFFLLGTMGAVIAMSGRIRRRDALLDVGAAGPLAGLAVALPVLIYGLLESPIAPLPIGKTYWLEGRSLLYLGLLHLTKGPIPPGSDIMLSQTALAGWAGLFITMINLMPIGQLDGGHIAYALFAQRQERISKGLRALLPLFALGIALFYGVPAYLEGKRGEALYNELSNGLPWIVWWVVLLILRRTSGLEHPPFDPGLLSPARRWVAAITLCLFVLLVMPSPMREITLPR